MSVRCEETDSMGYPGIRPPARGRVPPFPFEVSGRYSPNRGQIAEERRG